MRWNIIGGRGDPSKMPWMVIGCMDRRSTIEISHLYFFSAEGARWHQCIIASAGASGE